MTHPIEVGGFFVATLFAWVLYVHFFREISIDEFRFEMAVILRDLDKIWKERGLDYTHPAYLLLNETCGVLRNRANRLSPAEIFLPWLVLRPKNDVDLFHMIEEQIKDLPRDSREEASAVLERITEELGWHMLKCCPLVLAVVFPACFIWGVVDAIKSHVKIPRRIKPRASLNLVITELETSPA